MTRAETITSAANPLVKDVRRAVQRGALTDKGWCVAESFHLLDEALRGPSTVAAVLAAESVRDRLPSLTSKIIILPDALFAKIASTESSQGVIALVRVPEWKPEDLFGADTLVVVLDALRDPGNAGTIVRTAEAFGATGVMFVRGTASPYHPKTLRASAGSLFRLPFVQGIDAAASRDLLRRNEISVFTSEPARPGQSAQLPPAKCDLAARCAIVIGNEARGVSAEFRGTAWGLTIPTAGVESLNAAVAAGILLYEARRQRS